MMHMYIHCTESKLQTKVSISFLSLVFWRLVLSFGRKLHWDESTYLPF
uniref:Uncharacterized protein n=1 Tax=Nelumbo nucifera TaxID=4432 RepID=A0A822ZPQ1_NELNU|nr:TPA_asm: hypothetical protein HUJ06_017891 [Nelumbo nucifera]